MVVKFVISEDEIDAFNFLRQVWSEMTTEHITEMKNDPDDIVGLFMDASNVLNRIEVGIESKMILASEKKKGECEVMG